ncbi:hypothetical protein CVIRNUC_002007 [Coccomyxa viridis]|uniref:DUF5722 domain-containing protein n=1 Tax=Coccomyxa viridis TaxID=1274662 RepID=A0AAV1HW60_9CHLO|nr:hypothetical protein CVIRNUC_002007 [Coccomyxa viridis]
MTNQGVQPEPRPQGHFALQCPTKGAEHSVPTFHGKVLPFNYDYVARRRKYIIGLAAILGSLVACALAVGIVEALRARSMRRVVNTQPLDAGVSGSSISKGYVLPVNKQGIHDQRYYDARGIQASTAPGMAEQRYQAYMEDVQPGVRRYNVFWQPFESSGVQPSRQPMSCPSGYQLVPPASQDLNSTGYNRFHCYSSSQIQLFEAYLALDASHAIQSCATIWGIPDSPFRSPKCSGQVIRNQTVTLGCVPLSPAVMQDFQDFINFLAEHYNSEQGRFSHYIIWNEVANGDWFDASPLINSKVAVSDSDTSLWLDIYAHMLTLAHDAIQRHHTAPAMLYLSLDQDWERTQGPCPPFVPGMQHCHIGSKTVVEGMWQRLGTSMDWSLAIHPYGPPNMPIGTSAQETAGEYICMAHDIMTNSPHAVFTTHNDFQGTSPDDTTGLIPAWTGQLLNSTERMSAPTFAAYAASHPGLWDVRADHYCCTQHYLGCPPSAGNLTTGSASARKLRFI